MRVRISTTVDADRLDAARRRLQISDSRLIDRALVALLELIEGDDELAALERQPYELDEDVSWSAAPVAGLPYNGEVPDGVVELARARRAAAP